MAPSHHHHHQQQPPQPAAERELVEPAALRALVPPDAIRFALQHAEQLQRLLHATDADGHHAASSGRAKEGKGKGTALPADDGGAGAEGEAVGAMDPAAVEAFRLSYQQAFEDALRQSLPTAPGGTGLPRPQPEPEPEEAQAQDNAGAPAKGQPWPTVRPANWPDSKKPVTDDSRAAVDGHAPGTSTGPKPGTVLWTSRDRRTEATTTARNTWGAAEEAPEVMLKTLLSFAPEGLDARDEHGWTALMWCARLNRQANVSALLRAGATASLTSSKDMWRFPSKKTASQLGRIAQQWDNQDRTAVCLLLEAAESEEVRRQFLQEAYDARSEQIKTEHAAKKKDIVSEPATETSVDADVASRAKMRTLLREAEAKRIQAEAKAKRAARDSGNVHAELEALRAEHERYRASKEEELEKAREELLEVTAKVRSAELRAAHGL